MYTILEKNVYLQCLERRNVKTFEAFEMRTKIYFL